LKLTSIIRAENTLALRAVEGVRPADEVGMRVAMALAVTLVLDAEHEIDISRIRVLDRLESAAIFR